MEKCASDKPKSFIFAPLWEILDFRFQISKWKLLIIKQQFPLWDFIGTRIKRIQQI
jgi:hypothetical protein